MHCLGCHPWDTPTQFQGASAPWPAGWPRSRPMARDCRRFSFGLSPTISGMPLGSQTATGWVRGEKPYDSEMGVRPVGVYVFPRNGRRAFLDGLQPVD